MIEHFFPCHWDSHCIRHLSVFGQRKLCNPCILIHQQGFEFPP